MRRIIAAFIACACAISMFMAPTPALAYSNTPSTAIYVNNVDITQEDDYRVECGGGYAEFDPETGVLTLRNATITETYLNPSGSTGAGSQGIDSGCGIYSGNDVNLFIELVGDNTIAGGIQAWSTGDAGSIAITGKGNLNITADKGIGINAHRDAAIDGASVQVASDSYAILADLGSVHVAGGAHVEAALPKQVDESITTLWVGNDLTVDGGSALEVDGQILALGDAHVLPGATLTISNEKAWYALYVQGDMSITNATVAVTSLADSGVVVADTFKIVDSLATFSGTATALSAATVDFDGKGWYQWATSPVDEVKSADDSPYPSAGNSGPYLRFEPKGTTYELTVENGKGGGSYAAGTKVSVSADAYVASGHFDNWSIAEDPTGSGELNAADTAEATFTMPAGDVTLTANYEAHTLAHHAASAPACSEVGWEAYDDCACGYSTYKELPAVGHEWDDPKWSWSEDGAEFVATFVCASNPAHTKALTARPTSTVRVEPTCTEPGVRLHHAMVELDGVKYEATATTEIPALGHDFADGFCVVCGAKDSKYVAPEKKDPTEEGDSLPATGDMNAVFSVVPVFAGAYLFAAGCSSRRQR